MSLTGVIYGGIVVLWLCYLVPLALRRYDDAARSRSVERFSTAMRVLGRTEPFEPLDPRAVRAAARVAVRRRRRVLMVLLALCAAVATGCALGRLSWWALIAPFALVVGFLVVARTQVARSRIRTWERTLVASGQAEQPAAVEAVGDDPDEAPTEVLDTVPGLVVDGPQQVVAAAVATADGGSLWDPLPITLPTYVSKPRATRSVRTIDLEGPGAWTSGRLAVDETGPASEPADTEQHDRAHAVGD